MFDLSCLHCFGVGGFGYVCWVLCGFWVWFDDRLGCLFCWVFRFGAIRLLVFLGFCVWWVLVDLLGWVVLLDVLLFGVIGGCSFCGCLFVCGLVVIVWLF